MEVFYSRVKGLLNPYRWWDHIFPSDNIEGPVCYLIWDLLWIKVGFHGGTIFLIKKRHNQWEHMFPLNIGYIQGL